MNNGVRTEMSPEEFKSVRDSLGLNTTAFALQLRTARSTVNDWLKGTSPIPGAVIVACELLQERDKWVMHDLITGYKRQLDKDYPNGIPSDPIQN